MADTDTQTKDLYHAKGNVWEDYKAILAQYSGDEEISPEDRQALDRMDGQFKAIKEQTERRKNESEMDAFFNTVDTERRLPIKTADGKIEEKELTHEVKVFNALLRGGALRQMQRQVPKEWVPYLDGKTAMNRTTDAQGGFITPDIYVREFVNKKYLMSFVRNAPTRKFTMTSDVMHIPTINAATAAAVLTTEGTGFSQLEPTFLDVAFTAYKYTRIELASEELVADANFDLLNEVVLPDLAQAFALAENGSTSTGFTGGTGSGMPQGIVTGATSTTMTASDGNVTGISSNEIMKHYHRLPLQYRGAPSVGWMMNDATVLIIRQKTEAVAGQYLWQPGLQAGIPDRLLGLPVYVNNAMGVPASGSGTKTLLIADFQYYRIGDRLPLAINTLVERYAELGQVAFRGQSRFDAHVMIPEAIQVAAQAAS